MTLRGRFCLDAAHAARALDIARSIGRTLAVPAQVEQWSRAHRARDAGGQPFAWVPSSLASGTAGTAVLHATLSRVDSDGPWGRWAHDHLAFAAKSLPRALGLFEGWCGFLAAARYVAGNSASYSKLMEKLSGAIVRSIASRYAEPFAPVRTTADYDLVSGAAGALVVLDAKADASAIESVVRYLDWLTELGQDQRWRAPFLVYDKGSRQPKTIMANNLGMAHGMPGVLAALALSGPVSADSLVERTADRVVGFEIDAGDGPDWPSASCGGHAYPSRPAWCYGPVGVAGALAAAAVRSGRADWMKLAVDAIKRVRALPRSAWNLPDTGLCHGLAGVAIAAASVADAALDADLAEWSARCFDEIIDAYQISLPLGYRMLDSDGIAFENPGMLDGAAGVALALASAAAPDVDREWQRWFGLPVAEPRRAEQP